MTSVKSLDANLVEKKFSATKATQDSIQGVALWMLAHKSQCDQIVSTWLSILRTSKIERRLTLFYICNEIVQTCRKKHAVIYKDAFKEVLRDAAVLVRDKSISGNIKRIFKIWKDRGIYEAEFVQELLNLLNGTSVQGTGSKLLSEFNPTSLRESINTFVSLETDLSNHKKKLTSVNVELNSKQIAKLFKDRHQGKHYNQQVEESHKNLTDFVVKMEKTNGERVSLIDKLECGMLFYEKQYGEARIVTNAYRNFGNRIKNLQKKLEEQSKILPSPASPIPSPPMDAPSPVDSLSGECGKDNMETVDMDLSDEENVPHVSCLNKIPPPIAPPALLSIPSGKPNSMAFGPPGFMSLAPPFGASSLPSMVRPPPASSSTQFPATFRQQNLPPPLFFTNFRSPTIHIPPPTTEAFCLTPNNRTNLQCSMSQRPVMTRCAPPASSQMHPDRNPFGGCSTNDNLGQPAAVSRENLNNLSTFNNTSFVEDNAMGALSREEVNNQNSHNAASFSNFSNAQTASSVPTWHTIATSGAINVTSTTSQSELTNQLYGNSGSNNAMDPFSLLNKLLNQNKQAENTMEGNGSSILDILTKSMKPPAGVEQDVQLSSGSSTPVLDDVRPSCAEKEEIREHFETVHALMEDTVSETGLGWPKISEEFHDVDSDNKSSTMTPLTEKNILSTVSDIKPDVFEVLKSILNSTKQPSLNNQIPDQTSSYNSFSTPTPALEEGGANFYDPSMTDFLPQDSEEIFLDHQDKYYSEENYDEQPYEDEESVQENRSVSPPAVPPMGPLVAPKCFLENYAHVGADDELEEIDHTEMTEEQFIHGRHDLELNNFDGYHVDDDFNDSNLNSGEFCEGFEGDHVGDFDETNFMSPPDNFNYQPEFGRNDYRPPDMDIGFGPRPNGFFEFRHRFPKPRYFGRGHFPR